MKAAICAMIVLLALASCNRVSKIDESAVRAWAASPDVTSRTLPSLYTFHDEKGRCLAVGTGEFVESADGINLEGQVVLPAGFYVYPGKIRVDSVDEAIRVLRSLEPKAIDRD